jgi:hypothetical protein
MTAHTHSLSSVSPFPHHVPSVPAPEGTAHQQVCNRLLALPFPEFARCLARLLSQMGYEKVRLMGVTQGRGRNAYGGFDLQATATHGLSRSLLLAQVKQYRRPVPRSFVDELRGAMLRLGAQQGLLLTTAAFSPAAQEAAASAQHALPIRLVDGEELVRLLLEHSIPVSSRTPASSAKLPAIPSAFEQLDLVPAAPSAPPGTLEEEAISPSLPEVTITLTLGVPDPPGSKERKRRRQ